LKSVAVPQTEPISAVFFDKKVMSPKVGDGLFSGTVFRKKTMSPNFGDGFFGKALCPRILLIESTDGATLLFKVLAQTN